MDQLGTGVKIKETLCDSGCKLSSIAMALYGCGIRLNGRDVNPQNLNNYLTQNNGFDERNRIMWDAINKLGLIREKFEKDSDAIKKAYNEGKIVILQHKTGHWVLMVGSTPDFYKINNPGGRSTTST